MSYAILNRRLFLLLYIDLGSPCASSPFGCPDPLSLRGDLDTADDAARRLPGLGYTDSPSGNSRVAKAGRTVHVNAYWLATL